MMNAWTGLKRPLWISFLLGCTVSFLTTRALTLRLILPSMIYWSFVPLIQIAALAAVSRRQDRKSFRFSELIDLFFRGYSPWVYWLIGMCALFVFLSPSSKSLDWTVSILWLDGGAVLAVALSLYIDFFFFRSVLRRSRTAAVRDLALQRLISWFVIMGIIAGPTIWSDVVGKIW
jgi:hypothetical protein